jgi:hypothetical protein
VQQITGIRQEEFMSIYDRPYYESPRDRDRERGHRERDRSFGRRDSSRDSDRRASDDDDRGSWMSRERDEFERGVRDYRERDPFDPRQDEIRRGRQSFEPDFDPGDRGSRGERGRFDQLEDWQRPRDFAPGRGYGGEGVGPRGLPNRRGSASEGGSFGQGSSFGEGSWGGLQQQRGRYAGRGPKGYQRSDERIKEEICDRLTADADIDAVEIEVLVQGGEVTLQGSVPERAMKRAAEDSVEEISGVLQVHNRLRVEARKSDEDDRDPGRFGAEGSEGQRSSAGRKAH